LNFIFSGNNAKNNKLSGAGIGLIVSEAIIKTHGGKIWAENMSHHENGQSNELKGAKFSFSLPLRANSNPIMLPTNSESGTSKANIMVIDDEETCLLSLDMMFHNTNYILHKYPSPINALEFLNKNPNIIDVLLLDMMMPELDGIAVLKQLKSHDLLKNIPVIMQSGIADISQIDQVLSLGVKDFIRKPYKREILITSIENIIKSVCKK